MITVALFALLVVGYAIFFWGSYAWKCLGKLPSYPRLPIIGNSYILLGDRRRLYKRALEMVAMSEEKQLPFVIWMGHTPVLLLTDLDDIKTVTNTFIEKPYYYNFAQVWLGEGILTAPGVIWKRNIKKLAGAFTGSLVEGFQDIFNCQAQKLLQSLKTEVGRAPFDVMEKYLAEATLEAICQTALGVPKISESIITEDYYKAFNRTLQLILSRAINVLMHPNFLFGLTSAKRELEKCVQHLHNISETVMVKRKDGRDIKNITTSLEKNGFKSFLDILLDLNAKDPTFTMQQVRNEMDTIIVGGQETVATALFYIFLMIGCKSDVHEKLYREMKDIFGDSKRDVKKEDLTKMIYCEAVINEALRLYPPAPGVIRYADRDLRLKSYTIPKGSSCFIHILGVGRSKKYWGADALEFRPERWLSGSIPNAALLAFSTGKRACIGKKYAMAIMKTIVAYCVRDLVFVSEAEKMEFKIDVILRPVCGHLMQFRLREDSPPPSQITEARIPDSQI